MNFITQFIKGNWLGKARLYTFNPQKMKVLLFQLGLYLTKNGLSSAKETLSLIRDYLCDVSTGKYKDYELKKLTIIVGAIIYVVTPVDLLPDFIPAGFVDDLSILGWAASQAAAELRKDKGIKEIENKQSEK
jgi:uncharacterized membrane protein YkvA (DUF1232 family)